MLVSDRAIRRLNRDFRAKDQATDVLSFPQLEQDCEMEPGGQAGAPNAPPLALGDIVISIDTAARQARELGQSVAARIRTLLIHGLLHLLGYDHERSAAEARRMFACEHQLAALLDEAGRRLVTTPTVAKRSPNATRATPSDSTDGLRWSPAAMPQSSVKHTAKSASKRKPREAALKRDRRSLTRVR